MPSDLLQVAALFTAARRVFDTFKRLLITGAAGKERPAGGRRRRR